VRRERRRSYRTAATLIAAAVGWLDDVLLRIQANQHKKSARLRALHSWQELFDDVPEHADHSTASVA
jgi:hypothetical protein